jgi:osmotically-inducible protein OsmY
LIGAPDTLDVVSPSLADLKVDLVRTSEEDVEAAAAAAPIVAALLVDLDPAMKPHHRVRELRKVLDVPLYMIVSDEMVAAKIRALYADGAAGVIDWPREGLVLARFLAEMLSLRLAHGRASGPDLALGRAVRARLRLLHGLHEQPRVAVERGIVTVSGRVDTLPLEREIEACIAAVPGVTGLNAEGLYVVPEPVPDATIRQACRRVVGYADPAQLPAPSFSVDAGIITLAGPAAARRELTRLRNLATRIRGVRDVRIETAPEPRTAANDRRTTSRLQQLLDDVLHEEDLRVSVVGGVAVVVGRAHTLSQKRAAIELLHEDGEIHRVIDKIVVAP